MMWSRASSEALREPPRCDVGAAALLVALALIGLGACSSTPSRGKAPAAPAAAGAAPAGKTAAAGTAAAGTSAAATAKAAGATTGGAESTAAPVVHPEVPPAARADFDRAVQYMRSGNATEAELGFKQIAVQYPQFSAPLVNLAIMQRKDGHLDQAEATLKSAVQHENGSAIAWTELGATQRMRGEFRDAASSYEQAITADPRYAPAWRNLGVVSDLYLGDPNRALKAFEQYKQLTGEDKPVSGWIAELRQRLGLTPAKRPAGDSAPADGGSTPAAPGGTPPTKEPPSEKAPGDHPSKPEPASSPVNAGTAAAGNGTGG
jgi:tetratricopeptide (TPR) repeat protein